MCGLAGYHSKQQLNDEQRKQRSDIFKGLLCAMQRRGDDSTGVAFIGGRAWSLAKDILTASEFIQEYEMNIPSYCAIGHTRMASRGAVTKKNAHPFQRGQIVGAHNGSVTNHYSIDYHAVVDSEVIFSELDKSNNDFIGTFLKLRGSFAITWVDMATQTAYLTRKDNPLFYAYVKEMKTYFWASDSFDLNAIIVACIGHSVTINEVPANTVISIDRRQKLLRYKVEFSSEPVYTPVSTKKEKDLLPFPGHRDTSYDEGYYDAHGGFHYWETGIKKKLEKKEIEEEIRASLLKESGYTDSESYTDKEECYVCGEKIDIGKKIIYDKDWNSYCESCFEEMMKEGTEEEKTAKYLEVTA